jgi:hypothetical protein
VRVAKTPTTIRVDTAVSPDIVRDMPKLTRPLLTPANRLYKVHARACGTPRTGWRAVCGTPRPRRLGYSMEVTCRRCLTLMYGVRARPCPPPLFLPLVPTAFDGHGMHSESP